MSISFSVSIKGQFHTKKTIDGLGHLDWNWSDREQMARRDGLEGKPRSLARFELE
jgi:hypothetical protein